jgi:hypothetical protein
MHRCEAQSRSEPQVAPTSQFGAHRDGRHTLSPQTFDAQSWSRSHGNPFEQRAPQ